MQDISRPERQSIKKQGKQDVKDMFECRPELVQGRNQKKDSKHTGSLAAFPPRCITSIGDLHFGGCLCTTPTWLLGRRRRQSRKRASRRGRSGRHVAVFNLCFRNNDPFTRGLNGRRYSSRRFSPIVCLPIIVAGDFGISPFPASEGNNSSTGVQSLESRYVSN
jgi:hypothetical protein